MEARLANGGRGNPSVSVSVSIYIGRYRRSSASRPLTSIPAQLARALSCQRPERDNGSKAEVEDPSISIAASASHRRSVYIPQQAHPAI